MDNQNMTYPELRDLFVERNKTQLAKPVSACPALAFAPGRGLTELSPERRLAYAE